MFYARINKIRVFNNRKGFLRLFNRCAEMRIYSYVAAASAGTASLAGADLRVSPYLSDLIHLTAEQRREKLLVGENRMKGKVVNSTQYEKQLVEILTEAQERGEETIITVGYNRD
jgi:hypothetical protein